MGKMPAIASGALLVVSLSAGIFAESGRLAALEANKTGDTTSTTTVTPKRADSRRRGTHRSRVSPPEIKGVGVIETTVPGIRRPPQRVFVTRCTGTCPFNN